MICQSNHEYDPIQLVHVHLSSEMIKGIQLVFKMEVILTNITSYVLFLKLIDHVSVATLKRQSDLHLLTIPAFVVERLVTTFDSAPC